MLTKTQIIELSKKHNFYLKKRQGQNFLIDKNIRNKIVNIINLERDDVILEIGSGLGALTEELAQRCGYIYAIEKDKKLYSLSKTLLYGYKNLEILYGDFLEFDINRLLFRSIKIVGALPYYITTPIIEHIFNSRQRIDAVYITVQKEVGARLSAKPGGGEYGSLSLFVQFYSDVERLMDIKKDAFFPKPDVDSTLLRFKILTEPHTTVKDEKTLFKVIRTSFGQRRKTLLSALAGKGLLGLDKKDMEHLLNNLGIDKTRRAETLSLEEFANIADAVIDFQV